MRHDVPSDTLEQEADFRRVHERNECLGEIDRIRQCGEPAENDFFPDAWWE